MEERIRICLISFLFWPDIGGAQVRAEKQARRLQTLGHEVIVVTLRHKKQWKRTENLDGLPVVRIGGMFRRSGRLRTGRLGHLFPNIGVFLALWRLRHHYDIIHVCQLSPLAAVAAFIGRISHKPVIISIQSTGPTKEQDARIEQAAELMAGPLTDTSFLKLKNNNVAVGDITHFPQLVFGGGAILNYLRKSNVIYQVLSTRSYSYLTSNGFCADKIVCIPNGIDIEKFQPILERRPDPLKLERDIICVARMEYPKGIDVLLHSWKYLMGTPNEWHAHLKPKLKLVGDGTLRPQLERLAAELNIEDSVEFLGLRTDIANLLQNSWGFVLPSRWEGMSNALLEAMGCCLPCVATRVSGSENIIINGVNGLLVEPEDFKELGLALRRIIEDTELAQRLAQEGYATVLRDYQLSAVVEKCLKLYQHLLNSGEKGLPLTLEGNEK